MIFPKGILLDTSYKISNVWRLFFFYKSLIILLILKNMFKVHIFSVAREDRREKLFLEENIVKDKSWNKVFISTDMSSNVSRRWDNDLTQNLASS